MLCVPSLSERCLCHDSELPALAAQGVVSLRIPFRSPWVCVYAVSLCASAPPCCVGASDVCALRAELFPRQASASSARPARGALLACARAVPAPPRRDRVAACVRPARSGGGGCTPAAGGGGPEAGARTGGDAAGPRGRGLQWRGRRGPR